MTGSGLVAVNWASDCVTAGSAFSRSEPRALAISRVAWASTTFAASACVPASPSRRARSQASSAAWRSFDTERSLPPAASNALSAPCSFW